MSHHNHCKKKCKNTLVAYEPTTKLGLFSSATGPVSNATWKTLTSAQRNNATQTTAQSPSTITADSIGDLYVTINSGPINATVTSRTVFKFDSAGLNPVDLLISSNAGDTFRGITYNASVDRLYVIVGSSTNPRVLTFKTDGSDLQTYASFDPLVTTGFVNDLVFDTLGNLYVTDSGTDSSPSPNAKGKIFFIPIQPTFGGNVLISTYWSTDPLLSPNVSEPFRFTGANGIVFDVARNALFVGVTETGAIVKINILPNGSADVGKIFVQNTLLKMNDGMKMDSHRNIWVTVGSDHDSIVKVSPSGKVKVIAGKYPVFDYPSSLHIASDTHDLTKVFVVNSALFRNSAVNTSTYVAGSPNQHIGLLTITHQ